MVLAQHKGNERIGKVQTTIRSSLSIVRNRLLILLYWLETEICSIWADNESKHENYGFTDKMSKYRTPNGQNVERQNVEWETMPNAKMSNETKCWTDKMSNGTKCRRDIMSKVIKAEWDIMSNGTKCRTEITSNETKCRMPNCRMGQNVECQNVEWDKMSNCI